MKSIQIHAAAPLALLMGCVAPSTTQAPISDVAVDWRDQYWSHVSALCGQSFSGKMVSDEAVDADMAGRPMRMTVVSCSDSEIRIPFHVGPAEDGGKWDMSRTWVLRKTSDGVQLKHDHRHEDGTPDAVTNYGGTGTTPFTIAPDTGLAVMHFPVDDESIANFRANGLDKSVTNVWSIAVTTGAAKGGPKFTYTLKRTGEHARYFEVAFY